MNACAERPENYCPGLKRSRFRASDGKLDLIRSEDVVNSWNTTKNVIYQTKRYGLPLSGGERGCAMSHVRAWQEGFDASTASPLVWVSPWRLRVTTLELLLLQQATCRC